MPEHDLSRVEDILGYTFKNKELLRTALTHKTYAFEARTPIEFNERLEFLGDSVLGVVIAEQLYRSNRYFSEGELTRRRAIIVNNNVLAEVAIRLGVGPFLLLGRGEQKQEGAKNRTNLANTVEAMIGALYLDSDLATVRAFILEKIYTKEYQF